MHIFRLQNRSRLSLQFMLKSQFCSDQLTPTFVRSERFSHSLDTLPSLYIVIVVRGVFLRLAIGACHFTAALEFDSGCFFSSRYHSKFSLTHAQQVCFSQYPRPRVTPRGCSRSRGQDTSGSLGQDTSLCCLAVFNALTEF